MLQYYTSEAVLELRDYVRDRIDWYFDPTSPPIEFSTVAPRRDTKLETQAWAQQLVVNERTPGQSDAANAVVVYSAMADLTPHQASEDRLWTYLCHNEGRAYVAQRWLRGYSSESAHVVDRIVNHFFVRGNRSLIRDNGLSRLWWLGAIAHRIDPEAPRRFLDTLLYRQDVRSALIERPSVSMNDGVLRAIYAVMREDFDTEEKALFRREAFREWMKNLNRRGGVILLDAVPANQLDSLIRREADRALELTA
ncbi:MAG: DUF6339 family protein [Chloroflexi bacterium]|nr:DUF6339 family protein [Chloroflexota bacterium]